MARRRTLDEISVEYDHAEPVHPLRALWRNRFYLGDLFNTEGGMAIVLMDALLFVPVLFAAFFYPLQALLVALAILVVSFAGYQGWVIWERRHR
jgi:hypothetical protein